MFSPNQELDLIRGKAIIEVLIDLCALKLPENMKSVALEACLDLLLRIMLTSTFSLLWFQM